MWFQLFPGLGALVAHEGQLLAVGSLDPDLPNRVDRIFEENDLPFGSGFAYRTPAKDPIWKITGPWHLAYNQPWPETDMELHTISFHRDQAARFNAVDGHLDQVQYTGDPLKSYGTLTLTAAYHPTTPRPRQLTPA